MIIKFQIKKILECIFITAHNFGGQSAQAATHVATGSEEEARARSGSNRNLNQRWKAVCGRIKPG
jgi:hypothetical protein